MLKKTILKKSIYLRESPEEGQFFLLIELFLISVLLFVFFSFLLFIYNISAVYFLTFCQVALDLFNWWYLVPNVPWNSDINL